MLILMHNISFFSWFVFDEFIAKVLILSFYVDFELFLLFWASVLILSFS
jgi:hypothetical protein